MRNNPCGKKVSLRAKAKALVFQVLSQSHRGVAGVLEVGRSEVIVAGWSVGSLDALGMQIDDVTRRDVAMVYTQGRYKMTPKQRQSVHVAWKMIEAAQTALAAGKKIKRKDHPTVYDAIHSRTSHASASAIAANLRKEIFASNPDLLALGSGLEVRHSVDLGCQGLFATVDIRKDQLITFYDGPAIVVDDGGIEEHSNRKGWFLATGKSSKNSAVFVGFRSDDSLEKTSGLMSLTNSDRNSPNCQRHNVRSAFCVGGIFIPETIFLKAKHDIHATPEHPIELCWDYCVR